MKTVHTLLYVCTVVGVALSVQLAQAATIPVACDPDALVAAINTANNNGEANTIILTADCVYTLTRGNNSSANPNGLPLIVSKMTIGAWCDH